MAWVTSPLRITRSLQPAPGVIPPSIPQEPSVVLQSQNAGLTQAINGNGVSAAAAPGLIKSLIPLMFLAVVLYFLFGKK